MIVESGERVVIKPVVAYAIVHISRRNRANLHSCYLLLTQCISLRSKFQNYKHNLSRLLSLLVCVLRCRKPRNQIFSRVGLDSAEQVRRRRSYTITVDRS